jgi:hypothetical protein
MLTSLQSSVREAYGMEVKALGIKQLKISADVKKDIDDKIASVKASLQGKDVNAIRNAMQELSQVMQKVGASVYQQPGQQPPAERNLAEEKRARLKENSARSRQYRYWHLVPETRYAILHFTRGARQIRQGCRKCLEEVRS